MASPECERAIEDAVRYGYALLKFISPNDVGLTGGHQWGYYIPKSDNVWPLFIPQPPTKGVNYTHPIHIVWQNGRETYSNAKWYGKGTRSEYRITGFGKDFVLISHHVVGDLLVLIPVERQKRFLGYVLDLEDDIDEITSQLGVSPARSWALYERGVERIETEDDCVDRHFKEFARPLEKFPTGEEFSAHTWKVLDECVQKFRKAAPDKGLLRCMDTEFNLFKFVERKLCQEELVKPFKDVDDFIATAQTLLQRRKARAGRSLENHVERYLKDAGIPFEMRPNIQGKPDVVIPGTKEYKDPKYPTQKLFILGVKRTCRDRWRQVVNEAKRVRRKHILTIEQGISGAQLREMQESDVTLVVPAPLHSQYPPKERVSVVISFADFMGEVRKRLS